MICGIDIGLGIDICSMRLEVFERTYKSQSAFLFSFRGFLVTKQDQTVHSKTRATNKNQPTSLCQCPLSSPYPLNKCHLSLQRLHFRLIVAEHRVPFPGLELELTRALCCPPRAFRLSISAICFSDRFASGSSSNARARDFIFVDFSLLQSFVCVEPMFAFSPQLIFYLFGWCSHSITEFYSFHYPSQPKNQSLCCYPHPDNTHSFLHFLNTNCNSLGERHPRLTSRRQQLP